MRRILTCIHIRMGIRTLYLTYKEISVREGRQGKLKARLEKKKKGIPSRIYALIRLVGRAFLQDG